MTIYDVSHHVSILGIEEIMEIVSNLVQYDDFSASLHYHSHDYLHRRRRSHHSIWDCVDDGSTVDRLWLYNVSYWQ